MSQPLPGSSEYMINRLLRTKPWLFKTGGILRDPKTREVIVIEGRRVRHFTGTTWDAIMSNPVEVYYNGEYE